MPFLAAHISKITISHVRTGIFDPWKIVPVRTENCLRHAPHFHTLRCDMLPVRVLRAVPFSGRMYHEPSFMPQCGHTG